MQIWNHISKENFNHTIKPATFNSNKRKKETTFNFKYNSIFQIWMKVGSPIQFPHFRWQIVRPDKMFISPSAKLWNVHGLTIFFIISKPFRHSCTIRRWWKMENRYRNQISHEIKNTEKCRQFELHMPVMLFKISDLCL